MNQIAPSPRIIRPPTIAVLAVVLACCVAVGSAAASTNRIIGGITRISGPPTHVLDRDSFSKGSSGSVAGTAYQVDFTDNYIQVGRLDARAGYGSVGISASTSYEMEQPRSVYPGDYQTYAASGTATATFTDVLVTGPGSGNISTRLRLHLSGVLSTTASPSTYTDGSIGSATISFGIYVNNNTVGFGNRSRTSNSGGPVETTSDGLFAGFGDNGVLTTGFFSVPLNTPVTVKLEMFTAVQSRLDHAQNGVASASCQYYQSLSFATDQPVFDLPAGYTANSPDSLIVNNSYQPNTNAPVLNILSISNAVVLTWLATNQPTQLEYTTNILGPWSAVATQPILTNSQFVLTWTNKTASAFFRLRVP